MLLRFERLMRALVLTTVAMAAAVPASAQVVQSLQFGMGGFFPTGESGRAPGDVLVTNLNSLAFRIGDFHAFVVNGEWTIAFGKHIETGFGVGYQASTVPSYYFAVDDHGRLLTQELRLRIIPATAIVRFLPIATPGHVQPYVGVGAAALRWRYSETGEFVASNEFVNGEPVTFRNSFVATGTTPAFVFVYGLRVPVRGDVFALSLEGRYQSAVGKGLPAGDFTSDRIDLSGSSVNFMFMVRY